MNDLPNISVIMPTYNSGQTLRKALDSILNQSFRNYEIVLVDGQSTDNTLSILKEYGDQDGRIHWICQKDSGVYDAMNKGIGLAKGQWLYFLGSDDFLYDEKVLEDIAKHIEEGDADIIYGDVLYTSNNSTFSGEFTVLYLHTVGNVCHQSVFYNRSIFDKVGPYNLKYKVNADWDFNIRCSRHPQIRIKYVKRIIAVFNDVTGLSSTLNDEVLYKELSFFYIRKIKDLQNSREYIIGKQIYTALGKLGIVPILKKLRGKI